MRPLRLSQMSLAALSFALTAAAPAPSYEVAGSVPGPDGGWDYASVDPAAKTLYVAHGEAVMAVDLANGNAVRSFGTIAKAHAVVPIPGQNTLLVSSAHDDTVRLLDTGDGHEIARIAVGSDPDAAFYDPASGRAAVMNAKAGTVSLIDVAARKVVSTITLKPGLEFAVMGEGSTMFVNNEDTNEIAVADLKTGKVGAAIRLTGCEGPTGLGYDAATHQLISACANGKAVVVDARTRRIVRLLAIGKGPRCGDHGHRAPARLHPLWRIGDDQHRQAGRREGRSDCRNRDQRAGRPHRSARSGDGQALPADRSVWPGSNAGRTACRKARFIPHPDCRTEVIRSAKTPRESSPAAD